MAGIKPKGKVDTTWSPNLAYAVGLLASDGCVQRDGRHIEITSKDKEQLVNFCTALNINTRITQKQSSQGKTYGRVQFGDVLFWRFLESVGITPAKSKTLGVLRVPEELFFDFLRGVFDGDGSFYSYYDKRWRSSFMFYVVFVSASKKHIDWLRKEIHCRIGIKGSVVQGSKKSTFQLRYAKSESLELLPMMYYSDTAISLSRKREKILSALKEGKCPGGEIGKLTTLRW